MKYNLAIFADGVVRFEHEEMSLIAAIAVIVAYKKRSYDNVVITLTSNTESDE